MYSSPVPCPARHPDKSPHPERAKSCPDSGSIQITHRKPCHRNSNANNFNFHLPQVRSTHLPLFSFACRLQSIAPHVTSLVSSRQARVSRCLILSPLARHLSYTSSHTLSHSEISTFRIKLNFIHTHISLTSRPQPSSTASPQKKVTEFQTMDYTISTISYTHTNIIRYKH